MTYETTQETARRWKVTEQWVRKLLKDKRLPGALRHGRAWMIPKDCQKPDRLHNASHNK